MKAMLGAQGTRVIALRCDRQTAPHDMAAQFVTRKPEGAGPARTLHAVSAALMRT